jgi:hypothetical protein
VFVLMHVVNLAFGTSDTSVSEVSKCTASCGVGN